MQSRVVSVDGANEHCDVHRERNITHCFATIIWMPIKRGAASYAFPQHPQQEVRFGPSALLKEASALR